MNKDLEHPYLRDQIIPYIGNKRRLLGLIYRSIGKTGCLDGNRTVKFLDLFSGSGVVSRLGKFLGFEVYSNDWEYYAYIINYAFLRINPSDLASMFLNWGGIEGILKHLNNLPDPGYDEQFIAKYYSPRDDSTADYKKERLFYTRYNGLIIDKIRNEIERLYPSDLIKNNNILKSEKYLLVAQLLYQAATHTNTSGVFKAYHKGFGGFSGDALTRIMKKISLPIPVLYESRENQYVFNDDANKIVKSKEIKNIFFDIIYLDPPYNQHQYGSNYHLLNTIARWDKDKMIGYLEKSGDKKAGIREDWVRTRSLYCYRDTALKTFKELMENLNGRYVLISYNTEGVIGFEEMLDLISKYGKVEVIGNEYVKFRGGKQSIKRVNNNIEFVFIIDKKQSSIGYNILNARYEYLKKKYTLYLRKKFVKNRLLKEFDIDGGKLIFKYKDIILDMKTNDFFTLEDLGVIEKLDSEVVNLNTKVEVLRSLIVKLENSCCKNIGEEIDEELRLIGSGVLNREYIKGMISSLRKLAHKKYRDIFYRYLNKIKDVSIKLEAVHIIIKDEIKKIEELASKRFCG